MGFFKANLFLMSFMVAVVNYATAQELTPFMKAHPPTLKPGELEMTVTTDRKSYLCGEPISLYVNIKNKTDRIVEINADRKRVFFGKEIEIIGRKITSNEDVLLERQKNASYDGRTSFKVPETALKKNDSGVGSGTILALLPGKVHTLVIPIHEYYDLSLPDVRYNVKLKMSIVENLQYVFSLVETTEFEIQRKAFSSSAVMMAHYMRCLFSQERAMEILGKEAESILMRMEADGVSDIRKSPEHGRLMMILRTIDEGSTHLGAERRLKSLEENNRMSIKDLRDFIILCVGKDGK